MLDFPDQAALEAWLEAEPADCPRRLREAGEEGRRGAVGDLRRSWSSRCLCFGWIDGRSNRLDDRFYLQRITPRRAKSIWSQKNVERGRGADRAPAGCGPAGSPRSRRRRPTVAGSAPTPARPTITVPDDLAAALAAEPAAQREFEALDGANRYAVLWRVHTATHAEPRARSGSPTLRADARRGPPLPLRLSRSSADAEPEAALVDAGHRDRRAEGAGVDHHAVADVEADVADRRVEEDQVAGAAARRGRPGVPSVDCARLECGSSMPAAA